MSESLALVLRGALAAVAMLLLASCAWLPVTVDGVDVRPVAGSEPSDSPWLFVPVRAWITRDTVTPVSVGLCDRPGCPQRIAVAVVDVRGREARTLARSLRQPQDLARLMLDGNRRRIALVAAANRSVPGAIAARRMPRRVAAQARRLRHGTFAGFTLAMSRAERGERPAHAAVLARQRGTTIRVVIAVGAAAGPVADAVKVVAAANL
ncbi:hypothetical protein [Phreatobacter sp.]|uniref:hypothetical protein n=1 Tax=Phreatobacter sp. TaxID=1966341 RepID=UPI003F7171C7